MKKSCLRVLSLMLAAVLLFSLSCPVLAVDGESASDPPKATTPTVEEEPPTEPPDPAAPTEAATEPTESPTDPTEAATEPVADPSENTSPDEDSPTEPTAAPSEDTIPEEGSPAEEAAEPPAEDVSAPEPDAAPDGASTRDANAIQFRGYVYRANEAAPSFQHTYTLLDGTHTAHIDWLYIMRMNVAGQRRVAYCLEPDTHVQAGIGYGAGSGLNTSGNWRVGLTGNQQRAIGLAMLYSAQHHPASLDSVDGIEWETATQIIIWEIVMGMRSAAAPYACSDSSLINQFVSSSGVRLGSDTAYEEARLKTIKAKYDTISSEMAAHRVIPSFAGNRSCKTSAIHIE